MSVYGLANNISAAQTAGNVGQSANPIVPMPASEAGAGTPPVTHVFVLTVTGSGNVSATAQPVGSNDGVNFVNYGSPIVAASLQTVSSQAQVGNSPFAYLSAFVSAISGTNASATVTVSA